MLILPAIDIIDGRCVRLVQGDYKQMSVYNENPEEVAALWQSKGAEYLHLVDLDGAKKGTAHNDAAVKKILNAVSIPVQIGGGIRTMSDIKAKLDMGISRVILGTIAVTEPELTKKAIAEYGPKIAVGVDASNGKVAISGWTSVVSDLDSLSLIQDLGKAGVSTVIYTDVAKDGMMSGPNVAMYKEVADLAASLNINIIAAGGVTTIGDVRAVKETGIHGAIIGKSLYLNGIDLSEAIEVAK